MSKEQASNATDQRLGWPTKLLRLCDNYLSIFGLFLVFVSMILLLTFGLFLLLTSRRNPYFDIVGFLVLPTALTIGLITVPLGIIIHRARRRRYLRRTGHEPDWPQINLADRGTRESVFGLTVLSFFIVFPIVAVTSYASYNYTESTEFCAQACHAVMEPEATAHANSPHARVTCAECHIGSGASWFVKSKISGLRQVYAVLADSYSRPIPLAITELRPARETCEECHWPAKFFGMQYRELVRFSPDEKNTRRVVRMLLKTGGADVASGRIEGIHMHMVLYGRIEYVASDPKLQEIPWVKHTDDEGNVHIYRSDGLRGTDPPPVGLVRSVDCMDCHNRGAHHFRSPQQEVDLYMETGRLDRSLPYLKRKAVEVLSTPFPDRATAEKRMAEMLTEYYEKNYPEIARTRQDSIQQAIAALNTIYRRNFFPEMKVNWKVYPDNVGHMDSAGCMRCHDGLHRTDDGLRISSACDTCHLFLNPEPDNPDALVRGPFHHSMDLSKHSQLRCIQCHSGGPLKLCRDCHKSGDWLEQLGREQFEPTTQRP